MEASLNIFIHAQCFFCYAPCNKWNLNLYFIYLLSYFLPIGTSLGIINITHKSFFLIYLEGKK